MIDKKEYLDIDKETFLLIEDEISKSKDVKQYYLGTHVDKHIHVPIATFKYLGVNTRMFYDCDEEVLMFELSEKRPTNMGLASILAKYNK